MRILFFGTGEIALPSLQALLADPQHKVVAVVTQPDKPVGRHQELRAPAIKQLAQSQGVPVLQPLKLRAAEEVARVQALAPEIIVVMAYGQILPRAVLDTASVACLNLHASLLPRHRGAAPIHAAIEAGDRETGITIIYMTEELDAGDMLLKRPIPVRRRETAGTLHDRLAALAPEALNDALELLERGSSPRVAQDASQATYAGKLDRERGSIDWTAPQFVIERKIRAMNPWPVAFTVLPDGKKLKVFSAIAHRKTSGTPGGVLRGDSRGLLVGAGEGAVLLRDVQLEGRRRMNAGEFLRGHPFAIGTRLGQQVAA